MSDAPKFEVIDRRKQKKLEEERGGADAPEAAVPEPPVAEPAGVPSPGPRLVVNESKQQAAPEEAAPEEAEQNVAEAQGIPGMPPAPTADESREQKMAYEAAAQRLEDILRAQNPGVGKQPSITFEHLVQQFYVSAMIQMGAGTQEGQRPQIDILGARNTIDLLGVLYEKTQGNLTDAEDRTLRSVLFEVRMAFLDLTSMINLQSVTAPPPPPPGKR